jgi:hypothetical protein
MKYEMTKAAAVRVAEKLAAIGRQFSYEDVRRALQAEGYRSNTSFSMDELLIALRETQFEPIGYSIGMACAREARDYREKLTSVSEAFEAVRCFDQDTGKDKAYRGE